MAILVFGDRNDREDCVVAVEEVAGDLENGVLEAGTECVDERQAVGVGVRGMVAPGEDPLAAGVRELDHTADTGIEVERFYDFYDQDFFTSHGLTRGVYFSAERYGRDSVHPQVFRAYDGKLAPNWRELIAAYPLSSEGKASFIALLDDPPDPLADKSPAEKVELMRRISYSDYLRR